MVQNGGMMVECLVFEVFERFLAPNEVLPENIFCKFGGPSDEGWSSRVYPTCPAQEGAARGMATGKRHLSAPEFDNYLCAVKNGGSAFGPAPLAEPPLQKKVLRA